MDKRIDKYIKVMKKLKSALEENRNTLYYLINELEDLETSITDGIEGVDDALKFLKDAKCDMERNDETS